MALHALNSAAVPTGAAVTFEKGMVTARPFLRSIPGGKSGSGNPADIERTRRAAAFDALLDAVRGSRAAIARSWDVCPRRVDHYRLTETNRDPGLVTPEMVARVRPARLRLALDEALFGPRQLSLFGENR